MKKRGDMIRVVDGLSLVARQFLSHSSSPSHVIHSLVKTTTNILGLTRGNPKLHSNPNNPNPNPDSNTTLDGSDSATIVYFDHHPNANATIPDPLPVSSPPPPPPPPPPPDPLTVSSPPPSPPSDPLTVSSPPPPPPSDPPLSASAPAIEHASPPNEHTPPAIEHSPAIEGAAHEHAAAASPQTARPRRREPRERKVPSTPFARAIGFASLGAGLAWGTVHESASRFLFGSPPSSSPNHSLFLSEKNAQRLAHALCRMRGAALKIGQMLSIQDESLVPPPILSALEIVRQGADVMPRTQLNQVLTAELGPDWSSNLASFNYQPMAAASIGQVHQAVTKNGMQVAMKIQYPGVADSIESDIENVKLLLDYTNLIPKGLYLDQAMKVAKEELSLECDYELEAQNQKQFRRLLSHREGFYVPLVIEELSSKRVLTTELVSGIPIDKVAVLDQDTRNYVGKKLLELTLMELFVFRFMQTDPNWSNYLFDETRRLINLIDFGAARHYPKSFVDDYLRMVKSDLIQLVVACANSEKDGVIEMSKRLGFLTGMESEVMMDAHVQAGFVVGLPFSKPGGYDFGSTNITNTISNLGATMLRHRLTPPPDEAYSLHRKLSGAFLACIKLRSVVPCREMLLEIYHHYEFDNIN